MTPIEVEMTKIYCERLLSIALVAGVLLILTSCASQPLPESTDAPGFFHGFWNGLTIFFSVIGHLVDPTIRIYGFPNSGGWYDFGFFLGACSALGGGATAANGS
jgi:hypothetical protein